MKIAYILPSLDAKAPIFLAKRLSDFFLQLRNEVSVFYFDDIVKTHFDCPVKQIKMSESIDFDSFDIVHSHMYRSDKYVAKYAKQIHHAKTVSTVHCNIYDDLKYSYGDFISFIFSKVWLHYLKRINVTVQINDYLMKLYEKSLRRSTLIYNGIAISEEQDDYSEIIRQISAFHTKNLSVLCSYSGIVKRKGLLQVLELLRIRKDLAYICIGNGEQKEALIDYAAKNGISDRVFFSPFKKNPYHVMKYADVFVIPSYSEGCSLALLEAGTVGAAVVCSDIPAFSMPFCNNEVSFFSLDNIDSFSRAVDDVQCHKEEKIKSLQARIKKDFSEGKMFSEYEKLYQKL